VVVPAAVEADKKFDGCEGLKGMWSARNGEKEWNGEKEKGKNSNEYREEKRGKSRSPRTSQT